MIEYWKTCGNEISHMSMIGGKYKIPYHTYDKFFTYYLKQIPYVYLVEKVKYPCKFFVDIDKCLFDLKTICKHLIDDQEYIVCTCEKNGNYHIIFQNIVANTPDDCLYLVNKYFKHILIDTSVYYTGLRMIGSSKNKNNHDIYIPTYFVNNNVYHDIKDPWNINMLYKCSIHTKESLNIIKKHKEVSYKCKYMNSKMCDLGFMDPEYSQIFISCIKKLDSYVCIFTRNKYCTNIQREHKNANIYFVINTFTKKIQQRCVCKCVDTQCLHKCKKNKWFNMPIKLFYELVNIQ
jgi:hypothetical protein